MQMSVLEQTLHGTARPINLARVRNVAFTMRVQPHLFNLITHTPPGNKSPPAINSDTSSGAGHLANQVSPSTPNPPG